MNDKRTKEQGMPTGRCHAPGDPPLAAGELKLQQPFVIDAALAARLIQREVNPREAFTVHDGRGVYYRASVKELSKTGGLAVPYEELARSPEPAVEITLACAVLARQRMIFVMQKATELGVARIVPLLTEYSVPPHGLAHEKAHAWPGQIIRAAKQCRRSSLPEVTPPVSLDKFLASGTVSSADLLLCMDNVGGEAVVTAAVSGHIVLFVGPEGGFSDTERGKFGNKVQQLVLGGRVLRAETAVIAGLTAVQMRWGDFR